MTFRRGTHDRCERWSPERPERQAYRRAVVGDVSGAFNIAASPAIGPPELASLLRARSVMPGKPAMKTVRIGCSGWSYDEWRGGLYPDGLPARRRLERYAEVFDTVEVNATFYRLPKESTVRGWTEQVPGDFRFAVKASRYLTHMKRLHDIADGVERFWEPLEPLRRSHRLGPVLWQLPENFERDDDLLAAALDRLPRADHCFEFRHPSWFVPAVRDLLADRGASLAIGDDKRRPLPDAAPVGPFAYLSLHYGHRGHNGNYSDAELDGWRRRIAAWRSRRPVFVYLNNDWNGYAPANALHLRKGLSFLQGASVRPPGTQSS